jgi:hypothetical protein
MAWEREREAHEQTLRRLQSQPPETPQDRR